MTGLRVVLCAGFAVMSAACSSGDGNMPSSKSQAMRAEFLESCQARPEYASRKRAGTLDRYCGCVFGRTMRGLSAQERVITGFYLYGETHEGYVQTYEMAMPDGKMMSAAANAIGKAVKSCH